MDDETAALARQQREAHERAQQEWVARRRSGPQRPWLCPEPRCTPLIQMADGEYGDLTQPKVGHSWTCWGLMERPVTFVYDGVDHTNDCNACHYTPLKGVIRWQENPGDWETFATYYSVAARLAREAGAGTDD